MKQEKKDNSPDVIMLYQERDSVELAIPQIIELELKFKAYQFESVKLHAISEMKPKVLLLSSNNVKNSIRFYIDYLEEYGQNIAPHSAILLINNRETSCAYLACESGLFDNYAIINPLNEPFRLKLVLLQELKIIEKNEKSSLVQLASDGEEELASCIEHGVTLKKSFLHEVSKCETAILSATDKVIDNDEAKVVLQNLIGITLEEMNDNVTASIQGIIEQLDDLKKNNKTLRQSINKQQDSKKKSTKGIDVEALTADDSGSKTALYKVLVAEQSDLFSQVIEEIFADTVFEYLLVNDGQDALTQITEFKPDVVFLSYDLPTLNGLEVTRAIRKKGNKIPVIAYTHNRDKAVIKRWVPLGLSGYLIKPSKKGAIIKSAAKAVKHPDDVLQLKGTDADDIHWIDEYSVGNEDVDDRHKMLFAMIFDFFRQEGKQEAIAYFHDLSSYIDLDFEAEENLLKQINYPYTDEHIKKHDELRQKFILMKERLEDYSTDDHHKIAVFVYNWLATHILKEDMKYRDYALSIEETSFNE